MLAGLHECANHVRIALDLADVSNSLLCDVLIRWLRKERHSVRHLISHLLYAILHRGGSHLCHARLRLLLRLLATFAGFLLLVFSRLQEFFELLVDRLRHLWQVTVILTPQMSFEFLDFFVQLAHFESRLCILLQVLIEDLNEG